MLNLLQNTIPIFVKEKNVGSSNNNFTQEPNDLWIDGQKVSDVAAREETNHAAVS